MTYFLNSSSSEMINSVGFVFGSEGKGLRKENVLCQTILYSLKTLALVYVAPDLICNFLSHMP